MIKEGKGGLMGKAKRTEKPGSITRQQLEKLLDNYKIGKKPLAQLLGWGATTIMNYLTDDAIPDCDYTRRLYVLYSCPSQYYALLNECGDRLTPVAFRKSLLAVQGFILSCRLYAAAQYIVNISECAPTVEHLEAVLFFSQALSLGLSGSQLFDEDYYPDENYLPYRRLSERMDIGGGFVRGMDVDGFSAGEQEIMQTVSEAFEWYGPRAVRKVLAAEYTRFCGKKGEQRRYHASNGLIRKCYREVFAQNHVENVQDFPLYLHKRMNLLRRSKI